MEKERGSITFGGVTLMVAHKWWCYRNKTPKTQKRDFYENEAFFFKNRNKAISNETTTVIIGAHNTLHTSPNVVSTTKLPHCLVASLISPSEAVLTISLPLEIVCKSDNAGARYITTIRRRIKAQVVSRMPLTFLTRIYRVCNSIKNFCTYGCYQFNKIFHFFNPKVFFLIASYLLLCTIDNDFKNKKGNTQNSISVGTHGKIAKIFSNANRGTIKFPVIILSFILTILFGNLGMYFSKIDFTLCIISYVLFFQSFIISSYSSLIYLSEQKQQNLCNKSTQNKIEKIHKLFKE